MARNSAPVLWAVLALASSGPCVAQSGERSLVITTPVVAAAPGTTAVPDVEISYAGGELGDAFQMSIRPPPGTWAWVGTPQAIPGDFDTNCVVAINGDLLLFGFGTGTGAHVGPTPLCRAKVAVGPGASSGASPLPPVAPSLVECFNALAETVPCTFSGGTLLVGDRTGTASVVYQPPPSSSIALTTATTSIGVTYLPGSPGDGVVVSGCRLAGDAVVRPPRTFPAYLGFAGTTPVSGSIALACVGGLPAGNAMLTCDERINDGPLQSRSWMLACPETRVPPTVDYSVAPGSPINAVGGAFAGDTSAATLGVTIRNDGLGAGVPASSAVSDCVAPAPFTAELTPAPVEGVGMLGATGTLAIRCITDTVPVDRVLSCSERRGTVTVTRT